MKSVKGKALAISAAAGIVATMGLGATAAGAAPVKAKSAQQIALHCTALGDVTVVINGNGTWTPGHVVGSTRVLKPYEIHITGTFTPTGGTAQPISEDHVKAAPQSRKLDVCTFHQESSDSQGSSVIDGLVKVQYSGKRLP